MASKEKSGKKPEVTPWRNKKEFVNVAEAIFSNDVLQIKWALDQIKVWEARSYPALPATIDATVGLIRAVLEEEVCPDIFGNTLMYSIAIKRFVNLMTECVQNDFTATPINVAALKLGIPEWIVNLRHQAAHSIRPRIDELRHGAQTALLWLRSEYWDERIANLADYVPPVIIKRNKFEMYIATYKTCQIQLLCQPTEWLERKRVMAERNICLNHLKNQLKKRSKEFYEALLKPSVFFIEPKDLMQLLSIEDQQFFNTSERPEPTVDSLQLPKPLLELWTPLIKILNSVYEIPPFVHNLLMCENSLGPFHLKTACAWALELIRMPAKCESATDMSDPVAAIFKQQYWVFDWFTLTCMCAKNPSPYMAIILNLVIGRVYPPIPAEGINEILCLFAMQLNVFPHSNESSSNHLEPQRLRTWEDVLEDAYVVSASRLLADGDVSKEIDVPLLCGTNWQVATDIDWESIPLGHVFEPPENFNECPFKPKPGEISAKAAKNSKTKEIPKETSSRKYEAGETSTASKRLKVDEPQVTRTKPGNHSTFILTKESIY